MTAPFDTMSCLDWFASARLAGHLAGDGPQPAESALRHPCEHLVEEPVAFFGDGLALGAAAGGRGGGPIGGRGHVPGFTAPILMFGAGTGG